MRVLSRALKILGIKKDQVKILCLGLDGSGKTTIIRAFQGHQFHGLAGNEDSATAGAGTENDLEGSQNDENSSVDSPSEKRNRKPQQQASFQDAEQSANHGDDNVTIPMNSLDSIVPTLGFQVEIFQRQNVQFTIFDMSGAGQYRDMWHFFFKDCMGVLYVIDSSDRDRIATVRDEVYQLTHHRDLRNKPFVFLCNKQDLPNVMSVEECIELIGLQDEDVDWNIIPTKALEHEGLNQAVNNLLDRLLA